MFCVSIWKREKNELISIITENFYINNITECPTNCSLFGEKFVELTIKVIIHNWCTQINRILAGKINVSLNEIDHKRKMHGLGIKSFQNILN